MPPAAAVPLAMSVVGSSRSSGGRETTPAPLALLCQPDSPHIRDMAKNPDTPKKPVKTPKSKAPNSKASRPEGQPIGPALAELLNPAINRGESGLGSGTGLQPPPDNSWDRRSGGEAAAHRARASTRGTSDDVAKKDASLSSSTRNARGGDRDERSSLSRWGVGGGSAGSAGSEFVEAPPPPTSESELRSPRTPPLRGGR